MVALRSLLCGAGLLSTVLARTAHHVIREPIKACAAPPASTDDLPAPPVKYGMILYRAFELLDVFGPLNALQMLGRIRQLELALISQTMDPVTTEPMVAAMNPLKTNFFPKVLPTHTLETVPQDLEVLIVPGGLGTRSPHLNATVEWIAATYPRLRYLITVCTGSGLVAKSGVLDGRRVTTNKAAWATVVDLGPRVHWVGHARWVVDGNVWSSSGITAGIDVTMAFIEELYGADNATWVSNRLEYVRNTDPEDDPFADIFNVTDVNPGQ